MTVEDAKQDLDLVGLAIRNFRPFEQVAMNPLSTINVITGPNNVGKTALLLGLRRLTRIDSRFVPRQATPGGAAHLGPSNHIVFWPEDVREEDEVEIILRLRGPATKLDAGAAEGPHEREVVVSGTGYANIDWLDTPADARGKRRMGSVGAVTEIASRIVHVPSCRGVTCSFRRSDPTEYEERRYDGSDLFMDLVESFAPDSSTGRASGLKRTRRISEIVSSILGVPTKVWPVVNPPAIYVAVGQDPGRSISQLGEGIAQATIIAGALTSVERPILILEDPELGFHPLLQRRLLDTLSDIEGLLAFLATHSNHIMDSAAPAVSFHHLTSGLDGFRSIHAVEAGDIRALSDLGVRPSSLAASNCVIWVEGPSDAIYLEAWLSAAAPELKKWRDYSFSFFGGALLARMDVDGENDQLARLLRINPSFFLVADSDRSKPSEQLGKGYLERVTGELPDERFWITAGREIESYTSDDLLLRALRGKASTSGADCDPGLPLSERLAQLELPESFAEKKVELAYRVAREWIEQPEWPLDLRERLNSLVAFVTRCRDAVPSYHRTARPRTGQQ
jgi:hypothetical protein